MATRYRYLTEKDLQEGKEIAEVFQSFDEETKKIALVYIGALRDRQMLESTKKKTD